MTEKTSFHPELEAAFDAAQQEPTPIVAGDREAIALSQAKFDSLLKSSLLQAAEVRHQVIDRDEKPNVVLLERKTYDNLTTIETFFD